MEVTNSEKNKLKFKLKLPSPPQPQPQNQPQQNDNHVFDDDDDDDELEEGEIREPKPVPEIKPEPEPKPEPVLEEEVVNKRVCPHCSKEFSNGKALGGHLRVHAVEKDYKTAGKLKKYNHQPGVGSSSGPKPDPNPDDDDKNFPCTICGRRYSSQKALFGHMRSHPDRGYRGMEPPNYSRNNNHNNNNRNESDDSDESDENEGGSSRSNSGLLIGGQLPTWKVTGKRGGQSSKSSEFEKAAAKLMMVLANGNRGEYEDEDEDEGEDEDEDGDGAFMKKLKRIIKERLDKKSSGLIIDKKNKNKNKNKKKKIRNNNNDGAIIKKENEKKKIKSGIKEEKLGEIEEVLKEKGYKIEEFDEDQLYFLQYELGISSDFFTDFSDGSTSSSSDEISAKKLRDFEKEKKKKKEKKRKRFSGFEPGFEPSKHHKKDDDDGGSGGGDDHHDGNGGSQDWPCNTCGRIFASHQALGGHRSSHNKKYASKSLQSSPLALTLAHPTMAMAQGSSGLTDVGPGSNGGSRSGSGEVNGGALTISPPPALAISPSSQTSSPPMGSSGVRPIEIDLNVSLMDDENDDGVVD